MVQGEKFTKVSSNLRHTLGLRGTNSIWWPNLQIKEVLRDETKGALKPHKAGIRVWANLWNLEAHTWFSRAELIQHFNLTRELDPQHWWLITVIEKPHKFCIQWKSQKHLLPIPPLEEAPLHTP